MQLVPNLLDLDFFFFFSQKAFNILTEKADLAQGPSLGLRGYLLN